MPTSSLCDRYRSWFDYEARAHEKVLSSLHSVPASRRAEPQFQKAIDLVGHILAARWLWLHRFGRAPERPPVVLSARGAPPAGVGSPASASPQSAPRWSFPPASPSKSWKRWSIKCISPGPVI